MNTTTTRRIVAAAVAAGVMSLGTVVPAGAVPDPGSAPASSSSTGDHRQEQQFNGGWEGQRAVSPVDESSAGAGSDSPFVDGKAVDPAQVTLGLLAGALVIGAALVARSTRRHHVRSA